MKRNTVTIIIGVLLLLIFGLLLFTFQVRQNEIAVVTTFDRPTQFGVGPGLHWKWPPPIQKHYVFDQRIHNFEGRLEQTLTQDGYPVLVMVYVGWAIANPTNFFYSFPTGKAADAEPALGALLENGRSEVVGKHPFSHFVSTNPNELQFAQVEKQILEAIRPIAESKYGITVRFVGIKRLGLPESVTEKVFVRMQTERDREVTKLKAEGERAATTIRSNAERDRDRILAEAAAQATGIRGAAEKEASKSLAVFEKNPELALLLMNLRTLEESMRQKTTLVFDDRISPYDLLTKPARTPTSKQRSESQSPVSGVQDPGAGGSVLGTKK
jgi:modulator of FtsH protease HflC